MLSVIIPVCNEEKTVEAIINQINNLPIEKEIIVVNDCSKDRTESILRSLSLNNLKVIHHVSNRGKSDAVRTGIENSTGEYILIQDINEEYGLNDYPRFLEAIKNSNLDLVLGSRFRKMSGRNIVLSILFGVKLNDWFSRCQLMRRESLLKLLPEIKSANIAFEVLVKAVKKKMRVVEMPISVARNILVIRNDRFGEFLLNIPAIRALKELYPQSKLTLAVNSGVLGLAGAVECVDEVVAWEELKSILGKRKFDIGVVLNPTKEAHWAVFWAEIPVRVGYDRKWGFLLTHKLKDTKCQGERHEVDYNLELMGLIGAKTIDKRLKIKVDDNLFREFIGQKIVAIHPFTSDPVKQWPLERFKELGQRIKVELGFRVVMVGLIGAKNNEIASAAYGNLAMTEVGCSRNDGVDDGIVNMVNKTSLVELAALLKRCALLVSGDSGPVHLAASVGTPVVALFRNDLAGKTARRWGPWGEGHVVIERGNLEDISVDEVIETVKLKIG